MENKNGIDKNKPSGTKGNLLWASTLGINLVVSSVAGVVVGVFLDKWIHTRPVITIVFFCFGTFAGFRQIYKEIQKLAREDEAQYGKKQ